MRLKKGECVLVENYGPLYIVDSFRERDLTGLGWTVYCGINGQDGVSYQFTAHEVMRKLTRDDFDRMPKSANYPDQIETK